MAGVQPFTALIRNGRVSDQLQTTEDIVKRSSHFMAHHSKKLGLGFVGFLSDFAGLDKFGFTF